VVARQPAAAAGPQRLPPACLVLLRKFEQLQNRRSERWYRVFNELTVLLFTLIVVLVVVKPF
jgi:putative membrane protein